MRLMFCGFDIPANDIAQLWDVFGRQYYKKNHSTCNFPNSGFFFLFLKMYPHLKQLFFFSF